MKAESLRIAKVFNVGGDVHYILPYFQREYAWDKSNWQTLLNDILDLYDIYQDSRPPEHFMGSPVVINADITPVIKTDGWSVTAYNHFDCADRYSQSD
jgi:uncharacterized protein with ParB-like and HNH nuclease domain